MKASILDLRRRMSTILRALDRNEPVTILYRGKVKGVLYPATEGKNGKQKAAAHPAFGMWGKRKYLKNVDKFVRDIRKGRCNDI